MSASDPTVTIAIPVLDEEKHLPACLDALRLQTYPAIVEVLVIDGGSRDATRMIAAGRGDVRLLDNPRRVQAAALNRALAEARGEVFVRVDARCIVAPDYVQRCVEALVRTRAAMVGGAQRPFATHWVHRGIAAAMRSRLGGGVAAYRQPDRSGWVDTVYLGAFPTALGRRAGGYDESLAVNEDAELAIRMRSLGGVWLDASIRSEYVPRASLLALARQFHAYGRYRAETVRRHPRSLAPRQLAAPFLVVGLLSPWRGPVAGLYLSTVAFGALVEALQDPAAATAMLGALPVIHLAWGTGFLRGVTRQFTARAR